MYNYQKSNRYFAQVADDIKDIAENELRSLGAEDIKTAYRGLYFNATPKNLYKINYLSRLINRVLAPIISFDCHSDAYLYKMASRVNWIDFLDVDNTFAVFASVHQSAITHSKFASLRVKDAIVDQLRTKSGARPSVDSKNPDLWINLHIDRNRAVLSVDTSGGSLHRRGYRRKSIEAPMIETLAAAIIKYTGWDESTPLIDPFCGSGTLLCEAYMMVANIPPGIYRKKFGFQMLPDYDAHLWKNIIKEAKQKIKSIKPDLIHGSDSSQIAVKAALENCALVDSQKVISIKEKDVFDIISLENKTLVCNPPYGIRLNKNEDLSVFYKKLGDFLKQRCKGSDAYIYFGEREYIKNIGLKPSWKKVLSNGGLDGRLVHYSIY